MAERSSRKLAVILHADVVGSTALVQQNETLAHVRIRDAFQGFSKTIEVYGGATRELRGDALVAEFARASDALVAALMFQRENAEANTRLEDDLRPSVRVGISLGEVVIADGTVTGAGVVLGQRVEQLAEPGGVCITGAIHEAVPRHLPLDYADLGKREMKGFEEPVQVYRAGVPAGQQLPPPEPSDSAPTDRGTARRFLAAGAIAILMLTAGAISWWQPWAPREEPASVERMAFPLPDKPSIAVLPFANMSDDPKQEYFVDGMTEDLITDLSKLSGLFVIARNSVFTYKGEAVSVRQVAEELGVRYVLEGSVRRVGDIVRINAQLIDATTGGHLWAERYDGTLTNVFSIQDSVTAQITAALSVELADSDVAPRSEQDVGNAKAYDAVLGGWALYRLGTPDNLARSIPYFEGAIRQAPRFARAHAALAAVYWEIRNNGWAKRLNTSSFQLRRNIVKHLRVALESPVPLAYSVASRLAGSQGKYEESVAQAERAVALDPNDPVGQAALASALALAGNPAQAAQVIRTAMRLDPHYPPSYLVTLGKSQFATGEYEDATDTLQLAVKQVPDNEHAWLYLAAAYGQLGRLEENRSAVHSFNDARIAAGLSPLTDGYIDDWALGTKEDRERLRAALVDVTGGWGSLFRRGPSGFEVLGAPSVDAATAKEMHDRGALFVDMRRRADWVRGRIPGAINIVSTDLSRRHLGETAQKRQEVVFLCYDVGCEISPHGAAKAISWGYQNVYYFAGGMDEWRAAGLSIETGGDPGA